MRKPKVLAFKIRQKEYHLVNDITGEKILVFPPIWPGENGDRVKPKNEKGEWIRRFVVKHSLGVERFKIQKIIILTHSPKERPSTIIDGQKWSIKVIEK